MAEEKYYERAFKGSFKDIKGILNYGVNSRYITIMSIKSEGAL